MNPNPNKPLLRVLLVDDHTVVRVGLRNLVNDELDMCVAGEAGTCEEALRMTKSAKPDVVVLDLRLPDGSGVEIIDAIKRAMDHIKVLILTSFADDTLLVAALKAGADGYLLKDVGEADLIGAIREVVSSGIVAPAPLGTGRGNGNSQPSPANTSHLNQLTGQERRVFELVGRGHSNREVAEAAGLTEKTVRNYLSRVFEKLRVRRRSELVALYVANGPWRR